jgi:hypothetical protein
MMVRYASGTASGNAFPRFLLWLARRRSTTDLPEFAEQQQLRERKTPASANISVNAKLKCPLFEQS